MEISLISLGLSLLSHFQSFSILHLSHVFIHLTFEILEKNTFSKSHRFGLKFHRLTFSTFMLNVLGLLFTACISVRLHEMSVYNNNI